MYLTYMDRSTLQTHYPLLSMVWLSVIKPDPPHPPPPQKNSRGHPLFDICGRAKITMYVEACYPKLMIF